MDNPATYLHWGFVLISVPKVVVIASMIVLFAVVSATSR
jgi:hypothetical protein